MNKSNKYKWELLPFYSVKSESRKDLSAKFLYGKFLNYVSDDDYIGAKLAKGFLRRGNYHCRKNNEPANAFNSFHKYAKEDDKFKELGCEFYKINSP